MNSEKIKTVVIFVLVAIVIALGAYSLFGKDGFKNTEKSAEFVNDVQNIQSSMSYYLGSTYSDTFGVYTRLELLSGKATDKEGQVVDIKDNEDKNLPALINLDEKIERGNDVYYKISNDNLKELFNIDLGKYEGVNFYVKDDGIIKVGFEKTPDWWKKELDGLKINE